MIVAERMYKDRTRFKVCIFRNGFRKSNFCPINVLLEIDIAQFKFSHFVNLDTIIRDAHYYCSAINCKSCNIEEVFSVIVLFQGKL